MLWLAGGRDAVVSPEGARASAAFYGTEFVLVKDTGHNLMMEASYRETARAICEWLDEKEIGRGALHRPRLREGEERE